MEYLYIVMLLQENGKEISVTNIQKVFNALGREVDEAKIQLFVTALSVILPVTTQTCFEKEKTEDALQMKNVVQMEEEAVLAKKLIQKEEAVEQKSAVEQKEAVHKEEAVQMQETVLAGEEVRSEGEKKAAATVTDGLPEITEQSETFHEQPGRYVYGVGGKGVQVNLGAIGLDGANVYTIPYKEACIVVHDCPAEPYESEDENAVKEWLFTQQEVLDIVAEKFDAVLPMSFDMIIEGKSGSDPEEEAIKWLEKNYENFMETMSKIRNRQEYGIQVILDTGSLSEKLFETDEKMRKKKEEIDAKPEGIAYMERELLKDLVKQRIEEKADEYFKEFYAMIKKYPDDIVIGKVKKVGGNQQMLMNLSCLVRKDRVESLGDELEKIENHDGISVRFSGPWAPYSFVTPEKGVSDTGNG